MTQAEVMLQAQTIPMETTINMLDLKFLQKQPEVVAEALKKRNSSIDINEFLELDSKRRTLLSEVETLKAERNTASATVAKMKKNNEDCDELIANLSKLSDKIKALDVETEEVKAKVNDWLLTVPNMPDQSVPYGKDENDNVEVRVWGEKPNFSFQAKEHWDLGAKFKGLDFECGAKLAGSRFCVSFNWAAKLERALANYFLDVQTSEFGHCEVLPPLMVNRATMQGTGQLPKFEEDLFKLVDWDYFLIPTAEVPLTNIFANEVIDEAELPLKFTAATPCFRSEAGSAGKDTRGLIRQHQFTKVEMVHFAHPEKSFEQLEEMRRYAETLLERLELPYRTITLCSGDMGFSSAKTYDIEVWLPGQNAYREISSCSNCIDFQARRANIKFKPKGGKGEFVHTLNGSGLPTGRALVAVLENYQEEDCIRVPKVLQSYMKMDVIR